MISPALRQVLRFKPGGVVATWNPLDKSAGLTLTNGNLTGTADNSGGWKSARGTSSSTTAKKYFEYHADLMVTASNYIVGLANSTESLANFAGQTANSVGMSGSGTVFVSGGIATTIQTFAQGDTLCIAVDLAGQNIWFRTNAGNWNNNGSANPATGVGGIPIAGVTFSTGLFPMMSPNATAEAGTANFGATAYAQAVPSGFGKW